MNLPFSNFRVSGFSNPTQIVITLTDLTHAEVFLSSQIILILDGVLTNCINVGLEARDDFVQIELLNVASRAVYSLAHFN